MRLSMLIKGIFCFENTAIQKVFLYFWMFLNKINGEFLWYFPMLRTDSNWRRCCPIDISLGIDILLYSDVNAIKQKLISAREKGCEVLTTIFFFFFFFFFFLLYVWLKLPKRDRATPLIYRSDHLYFAGEWYKTYCKPFFFFFCWKSFGEF